MKRIAISFALFAIAAIAYAAPPNTDSLDELFAITKVNRMTEAMLSSADGFMKQSMREAFKGQNFTPEQQKFVDTATTKIMSVMKEELSWSAMRPIYIQIYQETFTQEEVDGLIAFYKTPVGNAVVEKMPVAMQKSMILMQARMEPLLQKVKAAIEQSVIDAKSLEKQK